MEVNKEQFLKEFIQDLLNDERKSWREYNKKYDQEGDYLRVSVWNKFKNHWLHKGMWSSETTMSAEDQQRALDAVAKVTPAAEGSEKHHTLSALKEDGSIMTIDEYSDHYNIPRQDIKSYKLITHNGSAAFYNIQSHNINGAGQDTVNQQIIDAFDGIIDRYKVGIKTFERAAVNTDNQRALKVTISDSHVGLDPNPKGTGGIFQYEYNADVYVRSMEKVYNAVLKEYNTYQQPFDVLLLDDLGDREDGWNGQTTRGGHSLPQNMTNAEVFDTLVDTNVRLVESLVDAKVANKIILRTVSNSNHSHDFALIVNKAIQKIINRIYSQDIVEVDILEKFIEHRIWGDHCFILTHGKDSANQKFGFPLVLDAKTINYVTDYIDHYEIDSKYIHVEKGDLHQISYQKTRKFDYRNFMSFAPPSSWQQGNFGDTYAGFSIQVIEKYSNEISHTDYFLQHKKKK